MGGSELTGLLERRDFAGAKRWALAKGPEGLAKEFPSLGPVEKLAAFKLLDAKPAMELFDKLSFDDQYFVFSGFDRGSIAPLTEGSNAARTWFVQLGDAEYRAMLDRMFKRP